MSCHILRRNLVWSLNLTYIDEQWHTKGLWGLWDIGDGMCGQPEWCGSSAGCGRVWNEPYCGGDPVGPAAGYKEAFVQIAQLIKPRPWVKGIFLGDEPVTNGVSIQGICDVAQEARRALTAAGLEDVFVYWNGASGAVGDVISYQSTPGNGGACGDILSIDHYLDSGEPEYYQQYYEWMGKKLLPGQGFFMVPGLFWYMDRNITKNPWELQLMDKLNKSYHYSLQPPLNKWMKGMMPWHWANRPTCAQAWCCRGAQDFSRLTKLAEEIVKNITASSAEEKEKDENV